MSPSFKQINNFKTLCKMGLSTEDAQEASAVLGDDALSSLEINASSLKGANKATALMLIDCLKNNPHIKQLTLSGSKENTKDKKEFYETLFKNLGKTKLSSLAVSNPVSDKIDLSNLEHLKLSYVSKDAFSLSELNFEKSRLKSFSFESEGAIGKDAMETVEKRLPKSLRHFELTSWTIHGNQLPDITAFPKELETLKLDALIINDAKIKALAENLPSFPNLREIELTNTKLGEKNFLMVSEALSHSTAEKAILTIGGPVSDNGFKLFMAHLKRPSSMIADISFPHYNSTPQGYYNSEFVSPLSDEAQEELETFIKSRKQTTAKPVINKDTNISSPEFLSSAAKCGMIAQVYNQARQNGQSIPSTAYLEKDASGDRIIDILARTKQLDKVFSAENWTNAKEMQSLYDALYKNQKHQLDGQNGRPSFIKNKSLVMQTALKRQMSSNKNR